MNTKSAPGSHVQELLKSLTAEQLTALRQELGVNVEKPLAEDALAKALSDIGSRLQRPAVGPTPGTEVDATGFLKSLDDHLLQLHGDVRSFGAGLQPMGELLKALQTENEQLRNGLGVLQKTVDEMAKAMRLPLPPRAVTGAAPIPHPNGERPGEAAHTPATMTIGQLLKSLTAKFEAETDLTRKERLASMLGRARYGQVTIDELQSVGIELK